MSEPVHIVLDETAIEAAGRGNVVVSRLIHRAHEQAGWYLYVPTCALVEADRTRPGSAEHLAMLPGVLILDLDLPAALAITTETTWAQAHTGYAASPAPDRPEGAVIATAIPDRWSNQPVHVIDINP